MRDRAKRRLRKALDVLAGIGAFILRTRNKPAANVAANALEELRIGQPERDDPTVRDVRR